MEKENDKKILKMLKIALKTISYFIIVILVLIGLFLVFYVVSGKAAIKKGHSPLVGLYTIISPSMTPNINVYDVVLTGRMDDANNVVKGDVITFYSTNSFFGGTPITHRVIEILNVPDKGIYFRTKGDANQKPDEELVHENNVIGKVLLKIPKLGRVQFFLASKGGWIIAILIPSLAVIAYDIYKILRLILIKNKLLSIKHNNGNI